VGGLKKRRRYTEEDPQECEKGTRVMGQKSKIRQKRMKKKMGSSLYANFLPENTENIKPRYFLGFCPFLSVLPHTMFYSLLVQSLCI